MPSSHPIRGVPNVGSSGVAISRRSHDRNYVPEPRPVKSAVELTALYYPGTEQMSEWDMVAQTRPEIQPLLGWYDEGNPWWLPIPTGWDDRPRSFAHSIVIRNRTPDTFAAICREARAFCGRNGIRHAIIHPVNEWQEGSYIEPNQEFGFAMYDAIRDAFCEKPSKGWPKNIRPSDVGLGPYDYPPLVRSSSQRWDFDGSKEGWYRQPYGAAELLVEDGCLVFHVTWRRNFNIRKRHAVRGVEVPFVSRSHEDRAKRLRSTWQRRHRGDASQVGHGGNADHRAGNCR